MRVVSLLPSATEIVCALGAGAELVGISHECDFPPGVSGLPVVTRARIAIGASSREIDDAVRAAARDALGIYEVDAELLARLQPDLVLTQDLCEVCAVSLEDVRAALARLAHRESIELLSLRPTRLAHVMGDIERVAAALTSSNGTETRRGLEVRIDAIARRAAHAPTRPRVASIEWIDPIMLGGTWMPELIALAGGVAVGVEAGAPAPTIGPSELAALAPDVVLVKPCGFSLRRTLAERDHIEAIIAGAVPTARLFAADGNAFFNRSGPRLVESLEILAACTHPGRFPDFVEKHRDAFTPL